MTLMGSVSPFINQIEVLKNGRRINLSPNHCHFLLVLVENPKTEVSFEKMRQSIWLHEASVDARLIRNIQSTKNHLVNVIKSIGVDADFIKPIAGKGYLLDAEVSGKIENPNPENAEIILTTELANLGGENLSDYQSTTTAQKIFGSANTRSMRRSAACFTARYFGSRCSKSLINSTVSARLLFGSVFPSFCGLPRRAFSG